MSLQQKRTRKCIRCKSEISNFSLSDYCNQCNDQNRLERERKYKAERIMNITECGFCGKQLLLHSDYDMKKCLYSLRGYIIKRGSQSIEDVMGKEE